MIPVARDNLVRSHSLRDWAGLFLRGRVVATADITSQVLPLDVTQEHDLARSIVILIGNHVRKRQQLALGEQCLDLVRDVMHDVDGFQVLIRTSSAVRSRAMLVSNIPRAWSRMAALGIIWR